MTVVSSDERKGKDFETLIKHLFQCLLLSENLPNFRELFDSVGPGFVDFTLSSVPQDRFVPDVEVQLA